MTSPNPKMMTKKMTATQNAAETGPATPRPRTTPTGQFQSELSPEALAQRQMSAYKMRLAGASFDDIGRTLGINRKTASRDVAAMHEAMHSEGIEEIEALRMQQAARLDLALFAIMPLVKKGHLGAIDRMLAIEKRRAELLGMDAPRRMEMTGKDGEAMETTVNIRERWTPEEARQRANDLMRRMEILNREHERIEAEKARKQAERN